MAQKTTSWRRVGKSNWYKKYSRGKLLKRQLSKKYVKRVRAISRPRVKRVKPKFYPVDPTIFMIQNTPMVGTWDLRYKPNKIYYSLTKLDVKRKSDFYNKLRFIFEEHSDLIQDNELYYRFITK